MFLLHLKKLETEYKGLRWKGIIKVKVVGKLSLNSIKINSKKRANSYLYTEKSEARGS